MKDIAALVLASFTYTPIMKKLRGGPLLNDIVTTLKLVAVGSSKRKMSLYASHDLTIVSVRRALGFNDVTFKPGLGAALVVELHMVNNEPFVELHYIENYEAKDLVMWEIPNCSSPCNLNNFLEAIESVIPSDWDTECQLNRHI